MAVDSYENILAISEKRDYQAFSDAYRELNNLYRKLNQKDKANDLNRKYHSLRKRLEKMGFKFEQIFKNQTSSKSKKTINSFCSLRIC